MPIDGSGRDTGEFGDGADLNRRKSAIGDEVTPDIEQPPLDVGLAGFGTRCAAIGHSIRFSDNEKLKGFLMFDMAQQVELTGYRPGGLGKVIKMYNCSIGSIYTKPSR